MNAIHKSLCVLAGLAALAAPSIAHADIPNYDEPFFLQTSNGEYLSYMGNDTQLGPIETFIILGDGESGAVQDGDVVRLLHLGLLVDADTGLQLPASNATVRVEIDETTDTLQFHNTSSDLAVSSMALAGLPTSNINAVFYSFRAQNTGPGQNANCTEDQYMMMLARITANATNNTPQDLSDLDIDTVLAANGYWDYLADECTNTRAWEEIIDNGRIWSATSTMSTATATTRMRGCAPSPPASGTAWRSCSQRCRPTTR